jgi:hypothetical protein
VKSINPKEDIQVRRLVEGFNYCVDRANMARFIHNNEEANRYLVEAQRCSRELNDLISERVQAQEITINQNINIKEIHYYAK